MLRSFLTMRQLGGALLPPATGGSADFSTGAPNGALSTNDAALKWDNTSSFSFSFWFYSGTIPFFTADQYLLSQSSALNWSSAVPVNGYIVRLSNAGRYNFSGSQNFGATGQHLFTTEPGLNLVNNRWYLVFGDVDIGAGGAHSEIVDSVAGTDISNSISFTGPGIAAPTSSFIVGNGQAGAVGSGGIPIQGFNGRIDSLGLWPRVITAGEKTTLKNLSAGLPLGVGWADIRNSSLNDATEWWDFDTQLGSLVLRGNAQSHLLTKTGTVIPGAPRLQ